MQYICCNVYFSKMVFLSELSILHGASMFDSEFTIAIHPVNT